MNMKEHILAALKEQFDRWEEVLAEMSEEQINAPHLPSDWSTKDDIAHLLAWQQRSIARVQAARTNGEPAYPGWLPLPASETEDSVERTNDWIYKTYCEQPWSMIHPTWQSGFRRFLELGELIPEIDLLDSGKYRWMKGDPLAFVFLASYDHHQEHLDSLQDWLRSQR